MLHLPKLGLPYISLPSPPDENKTIVEMVSPLQFNGEYFNRPIWKRRNTINNKLISISIGWLPASCVDCDFDSK